MNDQGTKKRKVSEEEINNFAHALVDKFKDKNDNDEIYHSEISGQFNVSSSVVDKIYIRAIALGLPKLILKQKEKKNDSTENPFINDRMSIMIGKSVINRLNEQIENDKFEVKDEFKVELDDDKIVLTRIKN
ncbi:hypothetical protein [Megalodesulfovibrio gigas]|uniref:Uncharacterized protein n=1 Tax=Megalodesulfovibrio gigas (strain ATCC 19364 / DSM 1382 / NCIMB 9332 / VKM B-1759) TaxID=1121448 RepID=T2GB85_MEGG1|nr:hypothetical protein [Megalodesulfovibrio gigas]AGW13850.1 hypothetical protein DGI_2083 [Megalodesulfovibrio gigas DSM 1382 = ATCC 19364]